MKVYGQLEFADIHNLSADPSAGKVGRLYWNTTSLKTMLDDGTNIRALLRNDQLVIIGNHGTAANNIRLHRGASGVLQFVSGADATAEGTLSTAINQISARIENYSEAGKPAFGNAGRLAWITDSGLLKIDTGSAWSSVSGGSLVVSGSRASPNAIVAASGISVSAVAPRQLQFIQGSGGAVDVSANPQIAAGSTVGQELTLVGRSDTNTVLLEHGTGLSLNGPWLAEEDSVLNLIWDSVNWVEVSRR